MSKVKVTHCCIPNQKVECTLLKWWLAIGRFISIRECLHRRHLQPADGILICFVEAQQAAILFCDWSTIIVDICVCCEVVVCSVVILFIYLIFSAVFIFGTRKFHPRRTQNKEPTLKNGVDLWCRFLEVCHGPDMFPDFVYNITTDRHHMCRRCFHVEENIETTDATNKWRYALTFLQAEY